VSSPPPVDLERRYALAEARLQPGREKAVRRGPVLAIAVGLLVTWGSAAVAVVDLRRLETPVGTAGAWTGAALFGSCASYRDLSLPSPEAPPDTRTTDQQCRDLLARTEPNRSAPAGVSFEVVLVSVPGGGGVATVTVRLTRAGAARTVPLELVRRDGRWRVVRTAAACAEIGCA